FVRENYPKKSVKKLAKELEVPPRLVRQGLRELGLEELGPYDEPSKETRAPGKVGKLLARLKALESYKVAFPLVVGLAFLLRLIHLLEVMDTPFFQHLHTDPFMYHHWAVRITEGDWAGRSNPVFYLGPLYPYFLAVIYSIFGPSTFAACFIQVLLSAASCGLVYHLGRRLFGPVAGLLAGLLAVFYGMSIFFSALILGATLIIFLDLLMLLMLVTGLQKPAWWKWVLAGVFFGLSAAARGNVVMFGPLAGLGIVLYFGFKAWKKWVPAGALLTLAFVVTISPLLLHNWLVGGDFVPLTSNAGVNFFIGNNAHSDGIYMRNARYKGRPMGLSVRDQQANFPEVAKKELGEEELSPSEISGFWVDKTFEEIGADFGRWLGLLGNKLKYYFNAYEVPNNRNYYFSKRFSGLLRLPLVTFGLILPLALAGIVLSWRGIRKRSVLVFFFLAHLVALVAFFVNARYRLVVVPVLLIYAGAMLRWFYVQVKKRSWTRLGIVISLLALAYAGVYHKVPHINYRANFLNLANAHRDLGSLELALHNYSQALNISPDFYYAYLKRGEVLTRLNRVEEAREAFNQALHLAKRNNDTLNIRRIEARLRNLKTTPADRR
ncbi:glycosyltransferase family 39 protein, partial [Myxococcota bacterium]